MSEQQVDVDQLRSMTETLTQLTQYVELLRTGAGGFAYMLPAEWQGPASQQFTAAFEMWVLTATQLGEQSDALQKLASAALGAYETTIDNLDTSWSGTRSSLG